MAEIRVNGKAVPVTGVYADIVASSPQLMYWATRRKNPEIDLRSINVEWARLKGSGILFSVIFAEMYLDGEQIKPGLVLLSGDAIALLFVAYDEEVPWLLLIEQPRGAVGESRLLEVIAGMIDEHEEPEAVACKEAFEEARVHVTENDLINLGTSIPSAGLKGERLHFFAVEAWMTKAQILALGGKKAGVDAEGERIQTRVLRLSEVIETMDRFEVQDAKLELALKRYLSYLSKKQQEA